jgi:GntR family transcriptional regulator
MAEPMYQRIAEDLRKQIESGVLKRGSQLPTELELREKYEASRNTIRDAIKRLTNLSLVETRPGQGTFVYSKIDPFVTTLSADKTTGLGGGEGATYLSEVREAHKEAETSEPRVELQRAASEIAARLRVPEGTQVISRHQERFIDGTPWSLQTSFYPKDFVKRGADRLLDAESIEEGTVRYLEATLGLKQVGYRDWITARAPDATETEFFKLPPDGRVAVFEIFRTAFDQNGTPMRVTVTVFPIDRNQFIVNVGDAPSPQYDTSEGQAVS